MDLRTHYPFSLLRYGMIHTFPSLQKNIKTDVAIMGAGISGALMTWHLYKKGINCVVTDKRHVGTGSTAASTSLIQYEIDTPLHVLTDMVGYGNAVRSYELCLDAINELEKISTEVCPSKGFIRNSSLQYASKKNDIKVLEKEFLMRKKNGFQVELLSARDVLNDFGFHSNGALKSRQAARLDAYVFTHSLLADLDPDQCPVFDHTEVVSIQHQKNKVVLFTGNGHTITAKKLVIACGYESQGYIRKKIEHLHCTYAVISEPGTILPWKENSLLWETAMPYLYLRTTEDNRVLIGGKDTEYLNINEQLSILPRKTSALQKSFTKLFPVIPFIPDFQWAGTFGTTKDGLPFIGSVPEHPNTYFALGYGGNGITFSLLAAKMITDSIIGKKNPDMDIFSFQRV